MMLRWLNRSYGIEGDSMTLQYSTDGGATWQDVPIVSIPAQAKA